MSRACRCLSEPSRSARTWDRSSITSSEEAGKGCWAFFHEGRWLSVVSLLVDLAAEQVARAAWPQDHLGKLEREDEGLDEVDDHLFEEVNHGEWTLVH
jgi:hypothetical protein